MAQKRFVRKMSIKGYFLITVLSPFMVNDLYVRLYFIEWHNEYPYYASILSPFLLLY